eukprot:CAMPEP_0114524944 /NCGR_PEP_ID=MMETSP0109-20121206/22137_1 /TAXON_ID=29199 /ORGANISM="Chlorarachnion reptans, Strain CCCM449" /LENGTH=458 /DNA_ID=CAMNT_0001706445 /DNA_START=79 /DNA_END=1455 /DNA_ORIENTATION=+
MVRKRKRRLDLLRPSKISLEGVRQPTDAKSGLGNEKDVDQYHLNIEGPKDLKDNIMKLKKIANGTTSAVYLALHAPTMRLVAVKVRAMEDERCDSLVKELNELHENLVPIDEQGAPQWIFNHYKSIGTVHPCEHILSYYGAYRDRGAGAVNLCCEYMDSGSLQRVVDTGGVKNERIIQHIAYGVLCALQHLEEYKTIHNDIKPANILVSHMGDVKVGDLGLACQVQEMSTDACGTLVFLAPERLLSQPHSFSADIWALGITLIAVATGKMPFSESTGFIHLQDMVVNKPVPGLREELNGNVIRIDGVKSCAWSPEFMAFVTCMLVKNPNKRFSARELLHHNFMKTHKAKDFREGGIHHSEWQDCIGTSAIDGDQVLPEIEKKFKEYVRRSNEIFCPRFPGNRNPKRVKAGGRWKKLKNRYAPTATSSPHPFVGVWDGIVNLATSLRMPTLKVENALGL